MQSGNFLSFKKRAVKWRDEWIKVTGTPARKISTTLLQLEACRLNKTLYFIFLVARLWLTNRKINTRHEKNFQLAYNFIQAAAPEAKKIAFLCSRNSEGSDLFRTEPC